MHVNNVMIDGDACIMFRSMHVLSLVSFPFHRYALSFHLLPPLPLCSLPPLPPPGELCPLVVQCSVVKAFKNFVEQMPDHDELLQSVCWTVSCVAFSTDG